MNSISINLLPKEVVVSEKDKLKQKSLVRLSVVILVLMTIISTGILFLRIFQGKQLAKEDQNLADTRTKVASFQDTEGLVYFLKQRLSNINGLVNQESKHSAAYNLVTSLTPSSVSLLVLAVNKDGDAVVSAESPDIQSLKNFLDNLTDPQKNQNRVKKVRMDSLSKSPNGFRIDLTIHI